MSRRNIYLASSIRNDPYYTRTLRALRDAGHTVYDFRSSQTNFGWNEIDPNWENWTPEQFLDALEDERSMDAFDCDIKQLDAADTLVMVTPCGRSAHLELGYAAGAGKDVYTMVNPGCHPELMLMVGRMVESIEDLLLYLDEDVRQ